MTGRHDATGSVSYEDADSDTGTRIFAGALLCVAACVGIVLRFVDLGIRPLAVDEYYFVQSVHSILEHGIPRFETGGYYMRGVLLQYTTAVSILLFGDTEFSYRLPCALANLGTVLLGYVFQNRYAKKAEGRKQGEEDVKSHYRKGVAGDWVNYFDEKHRRAFKEKYNDLLIKLGYETTSDW